MTISRDRTSSQTAAGARSTPVTSSVFHSHDYDPNTRKLVLHFKNGQVREYDDVGIDKATAFAESASPGAFFNAKIRNNFASRKVK